MKPATHGLTLEVAVFSRRDGTKVAVKDLREVMPTRIDGEVWRLFTRPGIHVAVCRDQIRARNVPALDPNNRVREAFEMQPVWRLA